MTEENKIHYVHPAIYPFALAKYYLISKPLYALKCWVHEHNTAYSVEEQPQNNEYQSLPAPAQTAPTAYQTPTTAMIPTATVQPQPQALQLQQRPITNLIPVTIERRLEQAMEDFGIRASVQRVSRGHIIDVALVMPARGVSSSTITAKARDIARVMGAESLRVNDRSDKGAGLLEIELARPASERGVVSALACFGSAAWKEFKGSLPILIGVDTGGDVVVADLAKLRHMLIGGETGGGKSVGLNVIIVSLLLRYSPQKLKFVMIDPKKVELSPYRNIPHLMHPIVTDMSVAYECLERVLEEMERRSTMMMQRGVRNIEEFNALGGEQLPFVVVVCDEYAAMCAKEEKARLEEQRQENMDAEAEERKPRKITFPKKAESLMQEICQEARFAGIHVIIATQRPSATLLDTDTKQNLPGVLAYKMQNATNSRIILDQAGAETLLGSGDSLFKSPDSPSPRRVHGAYLSTGDLNKFLQQYEAKP